MVRFLRPSLLLAFDLIADSTRTGRAREAALSAESRHRARRVRFQHASSPRAGQRQLADDVGGRRPPLQRVGRWRRFRRHQQQRPCAAGRRADRRRRPPTTRGKNIWGGFEPENPAQFGGKSYGILSVGGVLYMWVAPQPNPHLDHSQIALSKDHGATWQLADWKFPFSRRAHGPDLSELRTRLRRRARRVCLQLLHSSGVGARARRRRPPRTRSTCTSPAESISRACRRTRFSIATRYEFFTGMSASGSPTWSADRAKKQPVFEDRERRRLESQRELQPRTEALPARTEHTETHAGKLGIFDAPEPWGPWTTVAYDETWGAGHIEVSTFYWNFTPKWLSADGTQFTMIFTGKNTNDSWNTVAGRFIRK